MGEREDSRVYIFHASTQKQAKMCIYKFIYDRRRRRRHKLLFRFFFSTVATTQTHSQIKQFDLCFDGLMRAVGTVPYTIENL